MRMNPIVDLIVVAAESNAAREFLLVNSTSDAGDFALPLCPAEGEAKAR